jgi:hypothetical protein
MPDEIQSEPVYLLIISVLIVVSMLVEAGSRSLLRIPPAVGYITVGASLRAAVSIRMLVKLDAFADLCWIFATSAGLASQRLFEVWDDASVGER